MSNNDELSQRVVRLHGLVHNQQIDGEFTLKRVHHYQQDLFIPANSWYKTIEINPNTEFAVWGGVSLQ